MKVVMIGAGNVATHLSVALKKKNFNILQIFSRTEEAASRLAELVDSTWTTNILQLNQQADIYIFALKDSALSELIEKVNIPNALFLHTAGSIDIKIFSNKNNPYGVLYPLQTFSKTKSVNFNQVPLFIEGNNAKTTNQLIEIARKLSSEYHEIDSKQRLKLHLSAVFACNFTNYMYTIAEKIVMETQLPFSILEPLIAETADKIRTLTPQQAQTGPAVRFDTAVMDKHKELLAQEPNIQELYNLISQEIYKNSSTI